MATTPPRPCRHPGCPALITAPTSGYCAAHASDASYQRTQYDNTTRRNDPALAYAATVRNSSRWRAVRLLHKQQSPLCSDPYRDHSRSGLPAIATQSHHIVSLSDIAKGKADAELAYSLANLASLCASCHRLIEASERKGFSTAHLFNAQPQ